LDLSSSLCFLFRIAKSFNEIFIFALAVRVDGSEDETEVVGEEAGAGSETGSVAIGTYSLWQIHRVYRPTLVCCFPFQVLLLVAVAVAVAEKAP